MPDQSPWYLRKSPLGAGYQHFSNTAKAASVLDSKTKELIRLSVACVFRCPHCTEHHIKDALSAGATKEEITEAILLASLQAAGTQLNWDVELFEKYLGDRGQAGAPKAAGAI
jgi:AhpD family alkylhydroperoxidase